MQRVYSHQDLNVSAAVGTLAERYGIQQIFIKHTFGSVMINLRTIPNVIHHI